MSRKQPDRALRRGDGFIEERTTKGGAVRYVARWHDGVRWRGKTHDTYDDAEAHLQQLGRAKRGGRSVRESDWTVDDLLADYLRRGADRWSANTTANYRQIARSIIGPTIGGRRIRDLTPHAMQLWVDRLGTQYSAARVEVVRAVLSGAFKEAVRLGVVDRSPMVGLRGPKGTRTERHVWTPQQVSAVLVTVADDPELAAFYRVALTTGMRPGELRALQWRDIDAGKRQITVRRTVSRDAEFRPVISEGTKTGRARTIAVPQSTIDALQAWRPVLAARQLRAEHWRDLGLVWPRPDGNVLPQQTIAKRHAAVCDRAGVPRISPHGMRHTFATVSMEAGVPVKVVSDILGHSSISITLDVYTHNSEALQRSAAELLDDVLREA